MRDNFETRATTTKAYHDRKAGNAKPVLKPGDRVRARIQGSWTPAMVIDRSDSAARAMRSCPKRPPGANRRVVRKYGI